jgi:ribosomal protein S18 acetylase RimI-like enzyme
MQLRQMTSAEFEQYRPQLVSRYASEQTRVNGVPPEEASVKAEAATHELLPKGLDTPGMLMFTAEDDEGLVGTLWLSFSNQRGFRGTAWIYAIEVVSQRRGQGFGRALLAAAEGEVKNQGMAVLGLNVFGDNETARNLYQSAGYDVVTQQMRKVLPP